MRRCLLALLALVTLVACQSRYITFSLEKDGVLYNYSEMITFYYPREWNLTKDELKLSLDIVNEKEKEVLYFDAFDVEESNTHQELMALYEAKLKDVGVSVLEEQEALLESGQKCFYLTGEIPKNEALFCEVVVFVGNKQYIYSYIADAEVYVDNQETMLNYLKSLVVNEVMKTAL